MGIITTAIEQSDMQAPVPANHKMSSPPKSHKTSLAHVIVISTNLE